MKFKLTTRPYVFLLLFINLHFSMFLGRLPVIVTYWDRLTGLCHIIKEEDSSFSIDETPINCTSVQFGTDFLLCEITMKIINSPTPVITNSVGGPNNEYTVKSDPKSFADAKMDCSVSGENLVFVESLLDNVYVNGVCLDFKG